jgi:hypothetical protein
LWTCSSWAEPSRGTFRALALCGLAAPFVFTAAWVAGTLAQDSYSARREDVSALAAQTADAAWLVIAGLVLTGALTAAFAPALHIAVCGGRGSRLGPVLVALAGLGVIGLGLLRNDCSTATSACDGRVEAGDVSWQHLAHDALSIPVFAIAVIAPIVLARRFRADPQWTSFVPWSVVTAAALALLFLLAGVEAIPGWRGLVQRVAVTLAFLWLAVAAVRARVALARAAEIAAQTRGTRGSPAR